MKIADLFFIMVLISNCIFSQQKKDKKLLKNIETVNTQIKDINTSIDYSVKKKLSNSIYRVALSKEELSFLDSNASKFDKVKYLDSLVESVKTDKKKYFNLILATVIHKSSIEDDYDSLLKLFKTYGYLSESRLNRLNLSNKFLINLKKLLRYTPESKKHIFLDFLKEQLKYNNLNELELKNLEEILKPKA